MNKADALILCRPSPFYTHCQPGPYQRDRSKRGHTLQMTTLNFLRVALQSKAVAEAMARPATQCWVDYDYLRRPAIAPLSKAFVR